MNEAEYWKVIEAHDAELRQQATQFGYTNGDTPRSATTIKGETNEIVGQRVGIGKAETYRRAEKVWQEAKQGNAHYQGKYLTLWTRGHMVYLGIY